MMKLLTSDLLHNYHIQEKHIQYCRDTCTVIYQVNIKFEMKADRIKEIAACVALVLVLKS